MPPDQHEQTAPPPLSISGLNMAGRPPLPIGAYGRITTTELQPKLFEAFARYRDADGVTRPVKRRGPSRSAAETNLKRALADRRHNAGAQLTGDSRIADAAAVWFAQLQAQVDAGDRAPRTAENYESIWALHIKPALGHVRLREVTVSRCEAWLVELRKRLGAARCVAARAVLSGILGNAARLDAIAANPVRDLSRIPGAGGRKRKPRSLTAAERTQLLHWLDNNVAHNPKQKRQPLLHHDTAEVIKSRALGDVVRFMLATGCRIGEAMAVSWDEVDFDTSTVAIRWHLVGVRKEGIVRMPGAKSEAGDRLLRLPSWCCDMLLRRRIDNGGAYPVFPAETGLWRDPGQILRWLRWSREEVGFPWLTSHAFRQTVITVLDEAGLSTREVADQAGHSKVQQTHAYMQRRVASDRAADALESML